MELVRPTLAMIPAYRDALERGFSPHNIDTEKVRLAQLAQIERDPAALIALCNDPEGEGPPFERADGTLRPRLPGITRWMWQEGAPGGSFLGAINLRWQNGTSELPPDVAGHIGYVVCEWHRGHGYAAKALQTILAEARAIGLTHLDLTAEESNRPSWRTIERAGGRKIGLFEGDSPHHPCSQALLYRIDL